jgi:hypothetical protein
VEFIQKFRDAVEDAEPIQKYFKLFHLLTNGINHLLIEINILFLVSDIFLNMREPTKKHGK